MGRWIVGVAVSAALALAAGEGMAAEPKLGMITFSRLVQKLPVGQPYLRIQQGLLCATKETLTSDGLSHDMAMNLYGPLFMSELTALGQMDTAEKPNLFAEPTEAEQTTVYRIGGLIHGLDLKVCGLAYGDVSMGAKGSGTMKIQWQIYSSVKREVVATVETAGAYTLKSREPDGMDALTSLMRGLFSDSVRQLVASPDFKTISQTPPEKDERASTPGQQARLSGVGGRTEARTVAEAVGSVVLITVPGGHGSGVMVSRDGYVLTNAHVVADKPTVTVRWSDGYEAEGQVVRVHKGRDVALVKTDPHGREPLAARFGATQPGDNVFAIGAPHERELQGTVTRGIVSAPSRFLDGFNFIQSDVMVNPGNSGGALIDDKGALLGLTVLGLRPEGLPSGLNFFIPIKDALDFLSLDITPAAPATTAAR